MARSEGSSRGRRHGAAPGDGGTTGSSDGADRLGTAGVGANAVAVVPIAGISPDCRNGAAGNDIAG